MYEPSTTQAAYCLSCMRSGKQSGPSSILHVLPLSTAANPPTGSKMDDLDNFFGSAKPSAAPSPAPSYPGSPANMASPAASLGIPNDQNDFDLFGNVGSSSSAQHAQRSQVSPAAPGQAQSGSVDPFDLFGEGATVPASAAVQANQAGVSVDDSLFGDVGGYQGKVYVCEAMNNVAPNSLSFAF